MIEIRSVSVEKRQYVLYCEECEARFGEPVELHIQCGTGRRSPWHRQKQFFKTHNHDNGDLDARIETYLPDYDEKVKFAAACYAEDPKMPFAEMQRRWTAIEEMKMEVANGRDEATA